MEPLKILKIFIKIEKFCSLPPNLNFYIGMPLDGVIIDKRLPRRNLFYLNNLKKKLERYNFPKVFDLQNSSRPKFYRRFIIKKLNGLLRTSLEPGQKKADFDQNPVLDKWKYN